MIELKEDIKIKQIENGFLMESNIGVTYFENINDLTKEIEKYYS